MIEPTIKRAITFIDGQNLYRCAKDAFGYTYPNYDVIKLSAKICDSKSWNLHEVRFYTGVPTIEDDSFWHNFWALKLAVLGKRGAKVFSRPLRYHKKTINIPDYGDYTLMVGREKGIDIRIALDAIRLFREDKVDVIVIFSQDQDFTEVVKELNAIAQESNTWIKVASAFPDSPYVSNCRGIDKTDWIRIPKELYDACIDPIDYRARLMR